MARFLTEALRMDPEFVVSEEPRHLSSWGCRLCRGDCRACSREGEVKKGLFQKGFKVWQRFSLEEDM